MAESRIEINLSGRDARLYDRVRGWVVSSRPNARPGVRDMLLLLPDMVTLLYRLIRDPRVPPGAKVIAVLGLTYAASPIDVLPAFLFGPIGAIDDLIVVTATLSRILNHVHPDIVRAHWSGNDDALEVIHRVTAWSEALVGKTFAKLLGFRSQS